MSVTVHFYSYFKDLTGCAQAAEEVAPGSTIAELQQKLFGRFPKLGAMHRLATRAEVTAPLAGRSRRGDTDRGIDFQPAVLFGHDRLEAYPTNTGT